MNEPRTPSGDSFTPPPTDPDENRELTKKEQDALLALVNGSGNTNKEPYSPPPFTQEEKDALRAWGASNLGDDVADAGGDWGTPDDLETPLTPAELNGTSTQEPEPELEPEPEPEQGQGQGQETESEPESTPEKKSLWQRTKEAGKNLKESFKRADKVQLTKTVAKTGLGVVASIGGYKLLHDLPVYAWQKVGTEREIKKLHKQLAEAFHQNNLETDEYDPTQTALARKRDRLEQAINSSKSLSPEKKAELLIKVENTLNESNEALKARKTNRGAEMGKLLDEYIETRVKGMTVIKETINTALMASGLLLARGVAYGALSLVERYKKVSKEIESGERTEGRAKELIVNGLKETWTGLKGERGAVDSIKAWGVVLRFAGIAGMSVDELLNEGVSEKFNMALESLQQKGVVQHAGENLLQGLDKSTLGIFTSQDEPSAPDTSAHADDQPSSTDSESDDQAPTPETPIHPEMEAPPSGAVQEGTQLKANPEKLTKALDEIRAYNQDLENKGEVPKGFTDKQELLLRTNPELLQKTYPEIFDNTNTETTTGPEQNVENPAPTLEMAAPDQQRFSQEQLKLATVRQGDGLIRIAQRQLEADPELYGFNGDVENKKEVAHWVRKTAFAAVTKAGLANQDGWVGLGGKGIDKMAVTLSNEKDGIGFNFVDAKTGEPMDPATLQKEHFTYDYQKPAEAPLAETLKDVLHDEKPIDVGTTSDHDKDISFRSDISEQEKNRLIIEIRTREEDYAKTKALLEEFKTKYAGKPELPGLVADVEKRLEGIRLLEQDARNIALGTVPEGGIEVGGEGPAHDSPDTGTTFYGAPGSESAEPAVQEQTLVETTKPEVPEVKPMAAFISKLGTIQFEHSPDGKSVKILSDVNWNPVQYDRAQEQIGVSEDDVVTRAAQKASDAGSKAPLLVGRGESIAYKNFLAHQVIAEEMKASGLEQTKEYALLEKTNENYLKKLLKKFPDLKEKFILSSKQLDNVTK